jgi:dolichol-phosphate mannosyltransferase
MKKNEDVPRQLGVPAYSVTRIRESHNEIALVIPVINESTRLGIQLRAIKKSDPEVDIIIADGGSTDGSTGKQLLEANGVTVLLTKRDSGKLSAQLRMAIDYCLKENYKWIITMDGNGKDDPSGIKTISASLKSGFDFVQGSRFVKGGQAVNTPIPRYLAIRLIHAPITSLGARFWFTDTTNGFRGFSREILLDPRVAPLRNQFDAYELLAYLPIRVARLGYTVVEAPVIRRYPLGETTPTKIHGFRAHIRIIVVLLKSALGCYNP